MDTAATKSANRSSRQRRQSETRARTAISFDRTFDVAVETVWKMWTTKAGLERWWGPEGFESTVRRLDLKEGGGFEIVMTAVAPEVIRFVEASGVGKTSSAKGRYTSVARNEKLVYSNTVDFIPGVPAYETTTEVSFAATRSGGTRLRVRNERMHTAEWTRMAKMGWESQLGRLAAALI